MSDLIQEFEDAVRRLAEPDLSHYCREPESCPRCSEREDRYDEAKIALEDALRERKKGRP